MDLESCLDAALRNSRLRPASRFAVAVAEAQHQQALSAYWPQASLKAAHQRLDEAADFLFPSSVQGVPAQSMTLPASTAFVTIPPGLFGPDAVQLPVSVPSQTIQTPAQAYLVPEQQVRIMDPVSTTAAVDLKWLLFDGGMRKGLGMQTRGLVDAMKQESRRTDLEISDSVRRMYYGAVLARQLLDLGSDTLARMETTLQMTEAMYQGGSGRVTKADFLETKVTVESLRTMVAMLEKNEAMARAALANTMGLSWRELVTPSSKEIPVLAASVDLEQLVGDAYEFSPDWKALEAGLRAGEGGVKTARSGHAPKIALIGSLHKWWNSHDAGLATEANKEGWSIGVGMELPLFDGFLTRQKVAEAKARLEKLREQKLLLKEGIGLQIKDLVLGLNASGKACRFTQDARQSALENRELNVRAYGHELVDTEKVIRAQLLEAFMGAQYFKACHDHAVLGSKLSLVVGTELARVIGIEKTP